MSNPALCIDVSKSSSYASGFISANKPFSKPFSFPHTPDGMKQIDSFLEELEDASGKKPDVVLEATGNYSKSISQYFQLHRYKVIVLNPLQTSAQKRKSMRKVKTDPIDTYRIAQVYYMNDFAPQIVLDNDMEELRNLCRQWDGINTLFTETQLRYRCILDLIFPNFDKVFYVVCCPTALELISTYPSPKAILSANKEELIKILKISRQSRQWCERKLEILLSAARESLPYEAAQQSNIQVLKSYVKLLKTHQEILADIRAQIKQWAKLSLDFSLLLSIPGIGEITAATILGEIGNISRFETSKQLTAFAGLDPSVYQSGNFRAKNNKISKRGSHYLRKALYQATVAGISKHSRGILNQTLYKYYTQKLEEGKPPKVAIVATSHKLLRIIYGILSTKQPFIES